MLSQVLKPIAKRTDDSFKSPLISKEVNVFPETSKRDEKQLLAVQDISNILSQRRHEVNPIPRSSSRMRLFHDDFDDNIYPTSSTITPPLRASNPMTNDRNFGKSVRENHRSDTQRIQKHRATELGLFQLSPPITA